MDQKIFDLISSEEERQKRTISLIASENYPSPSTFQALSSIFAMKMAVGYPAMRTVTGCQIADEVECIAKERAEKLFGAEHANVQCTSGANANFAVYLATLEEGDTVIVPPLHLSDPSQGGESNISSRLCRFLRYEIDETTGEIDFDGLREMALRYRPRLITAGASSYPRIIDFTRFRGICDEAGALLHIDAAHLAGLIAGGTYPAAFPVADFMTCSSHKTMRGSRGGGLALCRAKDAEKLDRALMPGIQSAPVMSGVAACAIMLGEALQDRFKSYQEQVVHNARTLAAALEKEGFTIAFGGTDTHLLVIDLIETGVSGEEAMEIIERIGIMSNRTRLARDMTSGRAPTGLRGNCTARLWASSGPATSAGT